MFDLLTVTELATLVDKLNSAQHYAKCNRYTLPGLYDELSAAEHDVWHRKCLLTGKRCLQCG